MFFETVYKRAYLRELPNLFPTLKPGGHSRPRDRLLARRAHHLVGSLTTRASLRAASLLRLPWAAPGTESGGWCCVGKSWRAGVFATEREGDLAINGHMRLPRTLPFCEHFAQDLPSGSKVGGKSSSSSSCCCCYTAEPVC